MWLLPPDEIKFDWDEANLDHIARHDVSRAEAEEVFFNGSVEIDYQVVNDEERYSVVGRTNRARFLTLVFADREGLIRVITTHGKDSCRIVTQPPWQRQPSPSPPGTRPP